MREDIRRKMQIHFLRRLSEIGQAGRERSGFSRLEWIIREELGEATNRLHWHALVAGLPQGIITPNTCMFMMGYWEGIGGGIARIRVYDVNRDATSYIAKGLEDLTMSGGANSYEVGKFGHGRNQDSLMLIPSNTLLSQWKRDSFRSSKIRRANAGGASSRAGK